MCEHSKKNIQKRYCNINEHAQKEVIKKMNYYFDIEF